MRIRYAMLALAVAAIGACKDPNQPNLDNPTTGDFEQISDPSQVQTLVTGVLADDRGFNSQEISRGEILGRDVYIITQSEPRWITSLLGGQIDPSSFLGVSVYPYTTIRLANISIHKVDSAAAGVLTDEQKAGAFGVLKTFKALEYMRAIETRDTAGAPIDVDIPASEPPAPLRCKADVLRYIVALLDSAATDLGNAGSAFVFTLPSGFDGFDDPAGFTQFNRALAARANVYLAFRNGPATPDAEALDAADAALAASFMVQDDEKLELGPKHVYSTGAGDATNALFQDGTIYANPRVRAEADAGDARLSKIRTGDASSGGGDGDDEVTSSDLVDIYTSLTTPIPIITNKELLLLQAEVLWGKGDMPTAMDFVNFIRTNDGELTAKTLTDPDEVLDQILYEKRYSLLFQSASRWIDARLFGKMNGDAPPAGLGQERGRDPINNLPLPQAEQDARPGGLDKVCQTP